ncbi:OLC1v1001749C1 [Oldenlandia corymbosa var. corymbosa]|uniref:OLC1v1001749C1 n=1 Tax=Oldenlandia corymbosa var. corymbosa TaxID=529605 RepID=A0AAV1D6P6_OLDCO|nr:OLC1v1001749C1 [Oldenlandia corymbosa var. corymbosa]
MEFKEFTCSCCMLLLIGMTLCSGSRLSHFDQSTLVKSIKSKDGDVIDCVDISNQPAFDHHPLFSDLNAQGEEYYRGMAFLDIWAPNVRPNDDSKSAIWVIGGWRTSDFNVIIAGWMVSSLLYYSNRTKIFTYWVDLQCPGFVQISNEFALGAPFVVVSKVDEGLPTKFPLVISKFDKLGKFTSQQLDIQLGFVF